MKFLYFLCCTLIVFRLNHANENNISKDGGRACSAPGLMCDSCEHLVTCVKDGDDFNKLSIQTCAADETCLGTKCIAGRNPKCENEPDFPCNDIGVFPNPFDCQIYHFCVIDENDNLKDYRTKCSGSFGYHAGTTFCETRLENSVCFENENQFPVDLCLYHGQNAALSQNPSIYYICAEYSVNNDILYPFQFVCPHGGTYFNFECTLARKENYNKLLKRF